MSWRVINEILALAMIDEEFCQMLLQNPLTAIEERGYLLTQAERKAIGEIKARDIHEFSQLAIAKLSPHA